MAGVEVWQLFWIFQFNKVAQQCSWGEMEFFITDIQIVFLVNPSLKQFHKSVYISWSYDQNIKCRWDTGYIISTAAGNVTCSWRVCRPSGSSRPWNVWRGTLWTNTPACPPRTRSVTRLGIQATAVTSAPPHPNDMYSHPNDTYIHPNDTYSHANDTYSHPSDTYSHRNDTYTGPGRAISPPCLCVSTQ